MRKFNGKYYFIYSSLNSHNLCWAVSDRPDGGFAFGGTLVDQGDLFLNGNEDEAKALNYLGNTHGGMLNIGEDWYIFYHRQTNQHSYSRQACAEKLTRLGPGQYLQAEVTSCGLNGGPLKASGSYPAAIACHLTDPSVTGRIDYADPVMKTQIRVTQRQNLSFVTGIRDGAVIGYKYFDFLDASLLGLELRGSFSGTVTVSHDAEGKDPVGELELSLDAPAWRMALLPILPRRGKQALYLRFAGEGELELKSFCFFAD